MKGAGWEGGGAPVGDMTAERLAGHQLKLMRMMGMWTTTAPDADNGRGG